MKIATKEMAYEKVLELKPAKRNKPMKQPFVFRVLLKVVSAVLLRSVKFKSKKINMEMLGKDEPCLVLMNHSAFVDLEIVASMMYPRPFNIVATTDGFVGKNWLMRIIGCIPTTKFVTDVKLVRDMVYAVKELKSSVVMYPEASYSFDGTATPLPETIGRLVKMLGVPVVMIRTTGAFLHNPLYNNLRRRKVAVSAEMEYLLSPEDIAQKTAAELNAIINEQFGFDHFRWQQENRVRIKERFRAESLNRVLYKCPHCLTEGKTVGKDTKLACTSCGKEYELTEYGFMKALSGKTEFDHIPDWYQWERECVRKELENGTYELDVPVDICMMIDTKAVYKVGEGRLRHNVDGFHLTGCDGRLDYTQKPMASYSLYADYYWYEIGDVICIGDGKAQYYCFPKGCGDIVAKARLATEELYKIVKRKKG